jgi:hypothetical protein
LIGHKSLIIQSLRIKNKGHLFDFSEAAYLQQSPPPQEESVLQVLIPNSG